MLNDSKTAKLNDEKLKQAKGGKGGHGVIDYCQDMNKQGMCYDGDAQDRFCLNCTSCQRYPYK